jgi:1,2-diacylglycerol 3-alpha-glucosyltransferase
MKIAIFSNNYLPNHYGVSGSVESFRKVFEKLGHEVFIFAPEWKRYIDKNPNVYRYPAFETNVKIKFPLAIPYSRKISEILGNLDLDIIHSQHPNLLGRVAMRFAKKKNIPLIFTWHTLYDKYAHFAPFVPAKLAAWWTIRNARNYANKCNAVITPTQSVIDIIRKWGVTNENITAIPTGVDENQFSDPDREIIREKYGVKDDEILLVLVSRLTAEKNVEFLMNTLPDVLRKNNRVKFMICGDGDQKDKLIEIVSKKEIEDRIFFVGIVSDEIKKNYYAAGDIYVYASKSETQGMIITEAMYSGLPVVAVRATGVKDIVEDGKTGFLVSEDRKEFQDAVQKLIDDENMRKQFSREAKRVAKENYTSGICAKKMIKVYEDTIGGFQGK